MTATMVGASSCMTSTQQGTRKERVTSWDLHAKRQHCRNNSQAMGTMRPKSVVPIQAPAMAFPFSGVSGAAPRWSTAAALAAESRAAALPVGAHFLQASSVVAASAPKVMTTSVDGIATAAPLVLAHSGGQLVQVPVCFYGFASVASGSATDDLAPPRAAILTLLPLAAALDRFHSMTLARMLSALMASCRPPLRQHDARVGAPRPQWWPTGSEPWWIPDVVVHLPMMPAMPVPFAAVKFLKRVHKVAVLVAIVKHLAPDFARIAGAVRRCRMSASEAALWNCALENEVTSSCIARPVFVLEPQQHGGSRTTDLLPIPSQDAISDGAIFATTNGMAQHAQTGTIVAPADGYQQVANLASDAHIGDVVSPTPYNNEVHQVASVEAEPEELEPNQEYRDADTVVFPTSDLLDQQLEDMLKQWLGNQQADDDLEKLVASGFGKKTNKLSGAAAAGTGGEEQDNDRPWYENEEMRRKFAHMPIATPHSFDCGWYL